LILPASFANATTSFYRVLTLTSDKARDMRLGAVGGTVLSSSLLFLALLVLAEIPGKQSLGFLVLELLLGLHQLRLVPDRRVCDQ
jgi:hypothetical protein